MSGIAFIITVHNRKEKTRNCLNSIYNNKILHSIVDVFVTDDASTDGTKEMIEKEFPQVILINGTGKLFWCKGMNMAWRKATQTKDYDYYIWLNDDVTLFEDSISKAISDCNSFNNEVIIYGAMRNSVGELSYGAITPDEDVIGPDNHLQKIYKFCGNFLVVPKYVVKRIGIIDNVYSHAFGDFDYAMRAYTNNINAYLMPQYVGICEKHDRVDKFRDSDIPIIKRFKYLYSPLYTPIDHFIYNKRFFSIYKAVKIFLQLNLLAIFPKIKKQKL